MLRFNTGFWFCTCTYILFKLILGGELGAKLAGPSTRVPPPPDSYAYHGLRKRTHACYCCALCIRALLKCRTKDCRRRVSQPSQGSV